MDKNLKQLQIKFVQVLLAETILVHAAVCTAIKMSRNTVIKLSLCTRVKIQMTNYIILYNLQSNFQSTA